MDKTETIIMALSVIVPVSMVVGILIKDQWDDYKWNKSEAKRIKLKEAEQLIKHVKSMRAPSLDESVAIPQAKRRGRPSKAVTV